MNETFPLTDENIQGVVLQGTSLVKPTIVTVVAVLLVSHSKKRNNLTVFSQISNGTVHFEPPSLSHSVLSL
jgi:hypothetical protein